eukprot:3365184-Amphidinium_carterae.1
MQRWSEKRTEFENKRRPTRGSRVALTETLVQEQERNTECAARMRELGQGDIAALGAELRE